MFNKAELKALLAKASRLKIEYTLASTYDTKSDILIQYFKIEDDYNKLKYWFHPKLNILEY